MPLFLTSKYLEYSGLTLLIILDSQFLQGRNQVLLISIFSIRSNPTSFKK